MDILGHYCDLSYHLLKIHNCQHPQILDILPPRLTVASAEMQEEDQPTSTNEDRDQSTSANEDRETNCWGCGLRVSVAAYASAFKCGWCGAITKEHVVKSDNIRLRRCLDRFFVTIVISFMLFFICKHGYILINIIKAFNLPTPSC